MAYTVLIGQAPAAVDPSDGAFHDPALGQDLEALSICRTLDHLDLPGAAGDGPAQLRTAIGAVGEDLLQEGKPPAGMLVEDQAGSVDEKMALLALALLARIVARRVDPGPLFPRFLRSDYRSPRPWDWPRAPLRREIMDGNFQAESVHASWSFETADRIQSVLDDEELVQAEVYGLDCRSNLCRLEVDPADSIAAQKFNLRISLELAGVLPRIDFFQDRRDDGSELTVMYLARDGYDPANL